MTETNLVTLPSTTRCWVYNKIDNVVVSKIVTGSQAQELYDKGYRLSPYEFSDEKSFDLETATDALVTELNIMLNIDQITDRHTLVSFAKGFLNINVSPKMRISTIKKKIVNHKLIIEARNEEHLYECI